jgi:cytochrome c553
MENFAHRAHAWRGWRRWLAVLAAALPVLAGAGQPTPADGLSPSGKPYLPTPFTVPDTIAQRVTACTACHGEEGRATNAGFFPRIAGKPAGYLYSQLLNFRDGRRTNALMSPLLANLSDGYLHEIADYFSAQELPYAAPREPAIPAAVRGRGETLVRQGDAARGIPACAACHGAALTGVAPGIPALVGLPRDYLNAQLGAWRAGQRQAAQPDCMHDVARRLALEDIGALSAWLASQPVPHGGKPAAMPAAPLPLSCGAVPR